MSPETNLLQDLLRRARSRRQLLLSLRGIAITVAVVALLVLAGTPFLGLKWGSPDDRVLATTASARQVGDRIRNDFAVDVTTDVTVVIRDATRVSDQDLADYAARLSGVPNVMSVSAPTGAFVDGTLVARQRLPPG